MAENAARNDNVYLWLQSLVFFGSCLCFRKRGECNFAREVRDGQRGKSLQSNAFCATNARDFRNGDPEGKNRYVAIRHGVAESGERLESGTLSPNVERDTKEARP